MRQGLKEAAEEETRRKQHEEGLREELRMTEPSAESLWADDCGKDMSQRAEGEAMADGGEGIVPISTHARLEGLQKQCYNSLKGVVDAIQHWVVVDESEQGLDRMAVSIQFEGEEMQVAVRRRNIVVLDGQGE